jgi:GAF domain-containing protein
LTESVTGLLQVRYPYTDPLAAQRARGLIRVCVLTGLVGLAALLYVLATFTGGKAYDVISSIALIGALVGVGLTITLVQRGQERSASLLLVIIVTAGTSTALFPYGYDNVGALALSIPLVLAGMLFGWSGALVVLGFLLAALLVSTIALVTHLITAIALFTPDATPLGVIAIGGLALVTDALILRVFAGAAPRTDARSRAEASDRRLLAAIDRVIDSYVKREDLIAHLGDDLRDLFGYYYIQLFTAEPNGNLLIRAARIGAISTQTRPERRIAIEDQSNVVSLTYRAGHTRFVARDASDAERSEFLEVTQSELLVPLPHAARLWGVLDIQSTQPVAFERRDVELLEMLASRVASALYSLQTAAELRQTNAERQQLQSQVDRLAHDLERLRHESNERAWNDYLSGRELGRIGFDWANGQTTPNTDLTPAFESAVHEGLPQIRMEGSDQVLSVPISIRGQFLGTLVFRAAGETPWGEHSVELARLIGQRLALVLDNVRLLEQTQGNVVRERLINQVAVQLQAQSDMETLLTTAAEAFSRALGASSARVQLVMPGSASEDEA